MWKKYQRLILLKYDAVHVVTKMGGGTSLIFIAGISHKMSWDIFRQISRFWSWQWVVGVFAKVNLTLLWLIPLVLWIYGPPRHSQDTNRLKYSTLYSHIAPRLALKYEFSDWRKKHTLWISCMWFLFSHSRPAVRLLSIV